MFFYIIAALIVISSILVITRANAVHSAIWLVITLFFQAALFVLMGAYLVAGLQVLLYAGAIMVLILFVIMLLNLSPRAFKRRYLTGGRIVIASAIIYFAGVMGMAFWFMKKRVIAQNESPIIGSVESVGRMLLTKYAVPFELLSVLIIVAVVAAIVAARKNHHLSE
ncbi:MAG: NADH-quinone oxidoreductase subunit J [Deltaproteobacteria bacterium CG11_big_fil_rev_8_21_14_0_20_49_13]|nr:MAG: NADH-quinone oxidoreductase subunit J [Deltaproteobacteria bacterium CG11_big_fil_rev_8_21_14_0_20_49_13]